MPVSIYNVNNVTNTMGEPLCPNNPDFYLDNQDNNFLKYYGHTTLLTAWAKVVPCSTYHLILTIADNTDDIYDSGVFLKARSLVSNTIDFNTDLVDPTLIEGCTRDTLTITRQLAVASPQTVHLQYQGTATNGVDYAQLPPTVTIPAYETSVSLIINPLADALTEGIESLMIIAYPPCDTIPFDTIVYFINDVEPLNMQPDTLFQCGSTPVQLNGPTGYTTYQWTPPATLNNPNIRNPLANPVQDVTVYRLHVSTMGSCLQTDSVVVIKKKLEFVDKTDVACPSDNTGQITVSGGPEWYQPQYSINNGSWQSSGTFTGLGPGTYTLHIKDTSSCRDSLQVTIDITQPVPEITAVTTPATCSGDPDGSLTITLVGAGGFTPQYSIDNGATWQNSNVFNLPVGTYTVIVRYTANCTVQSAPINVPGIDNLTTLTTNPAPICEGDNVRIGISSPNATGYQWTAAPGLPASTSDSVTVSPTVTTWYYVKATYGACFRMDSVLVTVNPAPIPDAGEDVMVCNGYDAQLYAVSAAAAYSWSPATGLTSTTIRNPIYQDAAITRDYYLEITDNNGCTSLVKDTVRIIVLPGINFQPDTLYQCNNQPVQLNAPTGFPGYQWDADPTLSSTTIPNPVANPVNHVTVYTGHVNNGSCTLTDFIVVIKKDLEFITKTSTLCPQDNSGEIQIGIGPEWQWPVQFSINGTANADSTFRNLVPGTYTIEVRDPANCVTTMQQVIEMNEPVIDITTSTTPASCSGDPDGSLTVNVNGVPGTFTYSIDGGSTRVSSNIFDVVVGNYAITINYGNNCFTVSDSVYVPFQDNLTVTIDQPQPICEGTNVTIHSNSPTATGYQWSDTAGPIQGAMYSSVNVSPEGSAPATYYVTASQGVCTKTDSVTVSIMPAPIPDAGPNDTVCYATPSQLFSGNTGVEYFWQPVGFLDDPNSQNPMVMPMRIPQKFILNIKDANGCMSLVPDTATIWVIPMVQVYAGRDTMAAMGQPIALSVVELGTSGITNWQWSPITGLSNPASAFPVATASQTITYAVTGTTPGGCTGTDSITVIRIEGPEIYVPSAFTPNGDGLNDVLKPIPIGIKKMNYFSVFNRWGQRVYFSQQTTGGWDGRVKGTVQSPGTTFTWIAEGVDYMGNTLQRKGYFILLQ